MTALLVALGASLGAPVRYLLDRAVQRRHETRFPWGTFTVNVLGSALLGALARAAGHDATAIAGTGFCGAFTTYSTFAVETVRLGATRTAIAYVVASIGDQYSDLDGGYADRTYKLPNPTYFVS